MKKLHWAQALAVMVCVLLLAACSHSSTGPGATVTAFSKAMANGDSDTAVSLVYFGTDDSAKVKMAAAMMGVVGKVAKAAIDAKGGLDSVDVTNVKNTDATHATVSYTLHFGNGEKNATHSNVVLHNGKWLITR